MRDDFPTDSKLGQQKRIQIFNRLGQARGKKKANCIINQSWSTKQRRSFQSVGEKKIMYQTEGQQINVNVSFSFHYWIKKKLLILFIIIESVSQSSSSLVFS